MHAVVSGRISFAVEDCPPKVIEQLWHALSFPNPEYVSRQRMGRPLHGVPPTIECVEHDADGWMHIPRGAVRLLRELLRGAGAEVRFEDRRALLAPLGLDGSVPLRPYQQRAVLAMRRCLQGTILSPCGSGKSQMGVAAIGAIDQPALVLVHTHDLAEQWRERIALLLGQVAGLVAAGEARVAPITVATVQTLARMEAAALEELGQQFGCVVLDECLPGDARVITREHGTMPIRALVQQGARAHVLSFDHEAGRAEFQRIVRATSKRVDRRMVTIRIRRGRDVHTLRATEEHPVFIERRGYVPAIGVRPGDRVLLVAGGERSVSEVRHGRVMSVEASAPAADKVFDLEVEKNANFFAEGVLVHNCHHIPATTFRYVLGHLPGKYRFGLTATPERDDGLTPLLTFSIGPELFAIDQDELVRLGYLERPEVRFLPSRFTFDYGGPEDHHALMDALIEDEDRNQLIARQASTDARAGHTVLVLSGRVSHCQHLAARIARAGVKTAFLTGEVGKKERRQLLEDFRDGHLPVLVASTVADEGLDVPRLDRIVLAYPGRAKGRLTQRLGRLMRPHPGKAAPVLYDVVDTYVPPLARQWRERRRTYREITGSHGALIAPGEAA